MSLNFRFIGHCYDPKENHDKVWGAIVLSEPQSYWECEVLTFWGRRGKKLQTKLVTNAGVIQDLIRTKKKKYDEVDANRLNEVYPEFQADLEKTAMWALLKL
jgi:hypothetical protein